MQAVAFAALSAALFGTALVTTHSGLRHLDALSGARVSILSATLLFWLSSPFHDWSGWHAAAAGIFALVGLFFPAAVTLLTFEANRRIGPTVTGTVGSTAPLFAVLGAGFALGETLGESALVGTAAIVAGTMVLAGLGGSTAAEGERSALWLPLSAAVLRAFAQVLSKAGLTLWSNPFAAALVGYSVSAAAVWTVSALGGQRQAAALPRSGVAWFVLTGLLNGGAVLSMYGAFASGPVHLVSPIVATYPLFTLALDALVLRRERLTRRLLAGVALTVAGVVILLAWRQA